MSNYDTVLYVCVKRSRLKWIGGRRRPEGLEHGFPSPVGTRIERDLDFGTEQDVNKITQTGRRVEWTPLG